MTKGTLKPFLAWMEENGISTITNGTELNFIEDICKDSMTVDDCILKLLKVNSIDDIEPRLYVALYPEWTANLEAYDVYVDSMINAYCNQEWDDQDPLYV